MFPPEEYQRVLMMFTGFLSADVPELHDVPAPRLAMSVDRFLIAWAASLAGVNENGQNANENDPSPRGRYDS